MQKDCHRCGSPLGTPERFCPECGAPQLLYNASAEDGTGPAEAVSSTLREMNWKAAVGAAVTFAVPVGLMCSQVVPALSAGCCLWVVGGAVAAVRLYQRRSASRVLPRLAGMRIGTIIGILAAAVAAAFNGGAMVYERYVLHTGAAMDKIFQTSMEQVSISAAQFSSIPAAQAQEAMRFWLSADGRAALTLLSAVMTSAGITVFAMIGGMLGTRIFSGRNTSSRTS